MPLIAIVDDRPEQSSTVQNNIELELDKLGSSIGVIAILPFKNIDDYYSFIDAKEICVLILDERLNDQPIDRSGTVAYKGSDLVVELRKKLKEFPIFTLTVIPTDSELLEKQDQYEQIISRKVFYENPEKYVPIFVRAAKSYLTDHLEDLSQFNDLTKRVAGGEENPKILMQLKALQIKLQLPLANFDDRNSWLDEYEKQINSLELLNKAIKIKLEKN